jgi:hypothetical protein
MLANVEESDQDGYDERHWERIVRPSGHRHRPLPLALCAIAVGAAAVLVGSGAAPVGSADGYTYVSPGIGCADETFAYLVALRATLSPAEGATVPVGTPVPFTGYGNAEAPVSFAVASSPVLLANPDIDSGLGSAQPAPAESYTFTSTRASATPRTVYWDASFSTAGLKECEGQTPKIETTQPRTLTVLAPPVVQAPAPVRVSISSLRGFRLSHPAVRYRIGCTARCSGDTSYEVLVARGHHRAVHVAELDLKLESVSIMSEAGGEQQIAHDYTGRALRMLEGFIHAGDAVELRISLNVTGSSGNTVQAQRYARLRT